VARHLPSPISVPPVSRGETVWLAAALLAGAALRLANLQHVAVEHFDEVVYASNLMFPAAQGGEYPYRQLYAPPFLPAAIEWTTILGEVILGDVPSWWPMLPALVCGLAAIPSAWWIVRQWFSPRAGIFAALLMAFNEFHVAYSRTALTDVPLTLFVFWAVHRFWIALQTETTKDAIIAGALTSLAWWTKYNGWLPLAIVAAGGTLWQILTVKSERTWRRLMQVWLIGAATAFVLWLPVIRDCQKVGGYVKVAENHRGYVSGLQKWGPNLVQGYQDFDEFVGWISFIGVAIALAVRCLPRRYRPGDDRNPTNCPGECLAECLVGAWFWGLLVATPMYHPYSRLWTPWLLAASVLLAGVLASSRLQWAGTLAGWYRASLAIVSGGYALMIIVSALSGYRPISASASFERRDGLLQAARQIDAKAGRRDAAIVAGDSDPALWYHLRRLGAQAYLASSFEFAEGRFEHSGYLVLGPLSQRMENIQRELERRRNRFELVDEFPVPLSRVSLLDLVSPGELAKNPERRSMTARLYRVRS
jgi:4-amino-4-deoxy-L-arabinose transferase-like glycosyltransferase